MIRFPAGPHLVTAAAFVTAVAVVLNPVMPTLPDVTVPALPRAAAPAVPVPGSVATRPGVAAAASAPAALAGPSSGPGLGAVAYSTPAAPAIAVPRPVASPSVPALNADVIASATPPSTLPAMRGVATQLEQPFWMYDGSRQGAARTVQRVAPIVTPTPRPAAATQPGDLTTGQPAESGDDADAKAPAPQAHRQAVGAQGTRAEAPRAGSGTRG